MSSRSRKMLTLALNMQLAESHKETQLKRKKFNSRVAETDDTDYVPKNLDEVNSDSEGSENEGDFITKRKGRVNIISNTLVQPVQLNLHVTAENQMDNELIERNDNDDLYEIDQYTYFYNEIKNIVFNAVKISDKRMYTKKGDIRKRKSYDISVSDRKKIKLNATKEKHQISGSCSKSCPKKCSTNIPENRRLDINIQFWCLNREDQRNFMLNNTAKRPVKRKTVEGARSRRKNTIRYTFKDSHGTQHEVCKVFFLTTLGYHPTNDKPLRTILREPSALKPIKDKRGGSTKKFDRELIVRHIKSFNPTISHYRRAHAPNRLYLPSDITIQLMYKDFQEKHPTIRFSYYLYRDVVSSMNISFTKLGHEECYDCEEFDVHLKESGHGKDEEGTCENCTKNAKHVKKYREARECYKMDAELSDSKQGNDQDIYSADLQKVIMVWIFNFSVFYNNILCIL